MSGWSDKSEAIDLLSASLVKALGELSDLPKTRQANVGKYAYSYADLSDALQVARPVMARNGLAITQSVEADDQVVSVWTTVLHSSGQFLTWAPFRLPVGQTAQQTGSSTTYARRYSLMAALGLATEDDDGVSAAPRKPQEASKSPSKASNPVPPPRTPEEAEIRSTVASLPSDVSARLRGEFRAEFGCPLAELEEARHVEAARYVGLWVEDWETVGAE